MSENKKNVSNKDKNEKAMNVTLSSVEDFDPICDSKFLSSKGLCELVSQLFRGIYADFEGSNFEIMPGSNQPMVSLYFNHKDYSGSETPVACSKDIDDDGTKNATLRSLRRYNRSLRDGDRYFLTEEGKDGLADFLAPVRTIYKQNGDPDWKRIVAEVSDPNSMYYGNNMGTQYTKVSFLDPAKLVTLIFGQNNEDNGDRWEYGVRIVKSMPSVGSMFGAPTTDNNWMLAIDRVSEKNVRKLASDFGLTITSGLSIVR